MGRFKQLTNKEPEQKLKVFEFANILKTKSPEYKDWDNRELVTKFISANPEFSNDVEISSMSYIEPEELDLSMAENLAVSFSDTMEKVKKQKSQGEHFDAFGNLIKAQAQSAGAIGLEAINRGIEGVKAIPNIAKYGVQKAGEGLQDIAQTFSPESIIDTEQGEERFIAEEGRDLKNRARQLFRGISRLGAGLTTTAGGITPVGATVSGVFGAIEPSVQNTLYKLASTSTGKEIIKEWNSLSPSTKEGIVNIIDTLPVVTKKGAGILANELQSSKNLLTGTYSKVLDKINTKFAKDSSFDNEFLTRSLNPEVIENATKNGLTFNSKGNLKKSSLESSVLARVNKATPSQLKDFNNKFGSTLSDFMEERGIIYNRYKSTEELVKRWQSLMKESDEALKSIPNKFRATPEVSEVLDDLVGRLSKTTAKGDKVGSAKLQKFVKYKNKLDGEGLTLSEINDIKRTFERDVAIADKGDLSKGSDIRQLNTSRDNAIREFIIDKADESGYTNLREIQKELSASREASDILAGRMIGQASNNFLSLTDHIFLSPALMDPSFLSMFGMKKVLTTETVQAFGARMLSKYRRGAEGYKGMPKADLENIIKKAKEFENNVIKAKELQEINAIYADELSKSGTKMGEGFVTENLAPLSREEQNLIRATRNKEEARKMAEIIIEEKAKGKSVGKGFTVDDVDNTPLLKPTKEKISKKEIDTIRETDEIPFSMAEPATVSKADDSLTKQADEIISKAKTEKEAIDEFVNENNQLNEKLLKAQIISDANKFDKDHSSVFSEISKELPNYNELQKRMRNPDSFGNNVLPDYGEKTKYIEEAIDISIKNKKPVKIGFDKINTKYGKNSVPVVYFETPNGQVSFHMMYWGQKLKENSFSDFEYPSPIKFYVYDEMYKNNMRPERVEIPDRYKELFDQNYKWSGEIESRNIIEKNYAETKSQLEQIIKDRWKLKK
ncbi:MAG: hypothetical protein PHS54_04150 [Clostridia bacterium]|nr:hypothetical protein [Clostridia bacterium]